MTECETRPARTASFAITGSLPRLASAGAREPSFVSTAPYETPSKDCRSAFISQCVHLRISMMVVFFVPMFLVVLGVSFPVWYFTYHRQLELIAEMSAKVRRAIIASTGTAVDQIFVSAERDIRFVTSTFDSPSVLQRYCQRNWTEEMADLVVVRSFYPVLDFSTLRAGLALPVDGVMFNVNDIWLVRYNASHDFHAHLLNNQMVLGVSPIDAPNEVSLVIDHSLDNQPINPAGSTDGQTVIHPIPVAKLPKIVREPVWQNDTFFNRLGSATIGVFSNIRCSDDSAALLNVYGSIETGQFSRTLAEAVEGMQRMFVTLPSGRLVATSHGMYWSHSNMTIFSDALRATSLQWKWYLPQDCNDEIIHTVGTALFEHHRRWDLHNVDISISALGQEWLVISRTLKGPGRLLELWLIQDSESLFGDVIRSRDTSVHIFIGFCGGTIVLGIVVSYLFVRPLFRLQNCVDRVKKSEYQRLLLESRKFSRVREMFALQRSFRSMLQTLDSFAKYVPRNVIEMSLIRGTTPRLSIHRKYISVMFLDVCNFESMVITLSQDCVAAVLRHVFAEVSIQITKNAGIIDKFMGDSVMALWGATNVGDPGCDPYDHSQLWACRAAHGCILALQTTLRTLLLRDGLPVVRFRVGIHFGKAAVGNIGCEFRFNFTAIAAYLPLTLILFCK